MKVIEPLNLGDEEESLLKAWQDFSSGFKPHSDFKGGYTLYGLGISYNTLEGKIKNSDAVGFLSYLKARAEIELTVVDDSHTLKSLAALKHIKLSDQEMYREKLLEKLNSRISTLGGVPSWNSNVNKDLQDIINSTIANINARCQELTNDCQNKYYGYRYDEANNRFKRKSNVKFSFFQKLSVEKESFVKQVTQEIAALKSIKKSLENICDIDHQPKKVMFNKAIAILQDPKHREAVDKNKGIFQKLKDFLGIKPKSSKILDDSLTNYSNLMAKL